MELTHISDQGEARMVDVSRKQDTERRAVAEAFVRMKPETLTLITADSAKKGDVFAAARIAGILAAKRTCDLIPLCHPVPVDRAEISLTPYPPDRMQVTATVVCRYRTGVEMEAMTAASVAALTIYDMCKAVDRGLAIESVRLLEKTGGRSGTYRAEKKEE